MQAVPSSRQGERMNMNDPDILRLRAEAVEEYHRGAMETIAGAMGVDLKDDRGAPKANYQLLDDILKWIGSHRTICPANRSSV
jgi:hypothetical protein